MGGFFGGGCVKFHLHLSLRSRLQGDLSDRMRDAETISFNQEQKNGDTDIEMSCSREPQRIMEVNIASEPLAFYLLGSHRTKSAYFGVVSFVTCGNNPPEDWRKKMPPGL